MENIADPDKQEQCIWGDPTVEDLEVKKVRIPYSTLVHMCGKCFKFSNTFLFLFVNKLLVFKAGIHKFIIRTANREDPVQTASSEAVLSGSVMFV